MKLLRRLSLLLVATLVALLMAECSVRILPLLPISSMGAVMRPDPVLDHSLRPGSVGRMRSEEYDIVYRINSLGLRDDEPDAWPAGDTVLILGDSFMEGYGVERGELLADRLESISARGGRKWNVINAGVKSYSPLLEYLFLIHRGLAWKPDTVLLFFDLSDPANDIYYARRLMRDAGGRPASIRPRATPLALPGRLGAMLDRHSVLYAYSLHLGQKYFSSRDDVGYAGAALDLEPLFPGRDSISDSDYAARWRESFTHLRGIRDLLRAKGIAFAVVTYPYGHQVCDDCWRDGRLAHNFPPGVSSDRPFRHLASWAAAESIPVISLLNAFRNHPHPDKLYFRWDGHWTALGHEIAAEEIIRGQNNTGTVYYFP
ncbi:MAG: hypothetical protein AAB229_09195 [Candidatus Hydrogenedentota bacterium]